MDQTSFPKRPLGALLFTAGVLLSLLLTAALTWANFEAAFYGFQRLAIDPFDGLTCPPLMTPHETGVVRVAVTNPTGKTIDPIIRIDVSTAGVPATRQVQVSLAPGQTQTLAQTITAENIDLGFFIFAKAYRYPAYPLPTAEAVCGTLVVDFPFLTGNQIFALWLALCLIAIPLGLGLWSPVEPRRNNAARFLAVLALVGLLVSIQAIWILGMLVLALALLMSTTLLWAAQK